MFNISGNNSKKNLVAALKSNSVSLCVENDKHFCSYVIKSLNAETALIFNELSCVYHYPCAAEITKNYVDQHFLAIAETQSFLNSRVEIVSKVLSRSSLSITSELEVFKAANNWINFDLTKRARHSKDLLRLIRLPLLKKFHLSSDAFKDSSFANNKECLLVMKNISKGRNKDSLNFCCTTRHCVSSPFRLIAFSENCLDGSKLVFDAADSRFKDFKLTPATNKPQAYFRVSYAKGFVFVVGCNEMNRRVSLQKYCLKSESWEKETEVLGYWLEDFCVCVFTNELYLIGGMIFFDHSSAQPADDCYAVNVNDGVCSKIASTREFRCESACAVYREKVVVSGGYDDEIDDFKSVEAHDSGGSWSFMPEMVHARHGHSLVALRDKLFAVGGFRGNATLEVFDAFANKFSVVTSQFNFQHTESAFSVGNKIFLFKKNTQEAGFYDFEEDFWSEVLLEDDSKYECVLKIPQYD